MAPRKTVTATALIVLAAFSALHCGSGTAGIDGGIPSTVPDGGDATGIDSGAGPDSGDARGEVCALRLAASYPTGPAPALIASADFNGDRHPDLAVADFNTGLVRVLLDKGDGTFQGTADYTVGAQALWITTGDFNKDGRIDLLAAAGSANISMLLGNGDGTFQATSYHPTTFYPASIVTGDLDGDGRSDVIFADGGDNQFSVMLSTGDGTFQPAINYRSLSVTGFAPGVRAMVGGDFNGDGKLDLALAGGTSADGVVSVLLGNGNGTFQSALSQPAGSAALSLISDDFNGDHRSDLALVGYVQNQGTVISVFLGNGDGSLQTAAYYRGGGVSPFSVTSGDFDGDGRSDLAVTSALGPILSVLSGNGDGTFRDAVDYTAGSGKSVVTSGDFDGDGRSDLVVTNQDVGGVSVLLTVCMPASDASGGA